MGLELYAQLALEPALLLRLPSHTVGRVHTAQPAGKADICSLRRALQCCAVFTAGPRSGPHWKPPNAHQQQNGYMPGDMFPL